MKTIDQTEANLAFLHVKLKNHKECAAAKPTVFLGLPSPTIQNADKDLCKD